MPFELTLLLVRHGETAYNAEGRFQGAQDIPLSDRGREQASCLRARLHAAWATEPPLLPGPPNVVFASPLSRAAETARILATALPNVSAPIEMPLLRERSYGSWEGLTTVEIRDRFGPHSHPSDAEPLEEVNQRIQQALAAIWQQTLAGCERGTALVVGHGGSLRFFFAPALGIGIEAIRRFQMDNTGLSMIRLRGRSVEETEGRLIFANDTSHLAKLGYPERPRATPPR